MSSSLIITGSEFDASTNVEYNKPRINKSGGKNIALRNRETKKQLYLSTPLMMSWGVNENDFNKTGNFTYDMALQFPRENDAQYSDNTANFLNSLVELESKIKADAAANSKEWFNKGSMSAEVIDALWSPMLRYPKGDDGEPDRTRSPSLNVKLPCWDSEFKFELYDLEENQIFPPEGGSGSAEVLKKLITKTQNVALVIECGGIWFANGKFGVTWRLTQGVVKPLVTLKGKCHIKLDGATKKKLQDQKVPVQEEESTTLADDSDDEVELEQEQEVAVEEQAEVEVEVEAPPPPAPKKVVRRKKKA
jgi:hypothetical protein